MNSDFYLSFLMFALLQVLLTMLIHTCFFFACLPVVSHVWGRVGQGKESWAIPSGLVVTCVSPALARALPGGSGTALGDIPHYTQDSRGLLCSVVWWWSSKQSVPTHKEQQEIRGPIWGASPSLSTLQSPSSSLAAVHWDSLSHQGCFSAWLSNEGCLPDLQTDLEKQEERGRHCC